MLVTNLKKQSIIENVLVINLETNYNFLNYFSY